VLLRRGVLDHLDVAGGGEWPYGGKSDPELAGDVVEDKGYMGIPVMLIVRLGVLIPLGLEPGPELHGGLEEVAVLADRPRTSQVADAYTDRDDGAWSRPNLLISQMT